MAKIITKEEACSFIKDGSRVMFGGFLACGSAVGIIDLLATKDVKNLTLIANDTAYPDKSYGKLIANKQISKVIASHIGTNPETGKQMNNKEIDITLMPQGSLAECIRAAGAGLGGILTPTGLGTIVQENKQIINVKGQDYILEEAIHADVAIIYADCADKYGNLAYNGTTRNFNPLMAMASEITIVEVKEIIDGYLDPNQIIVPSVFVNYMVKAE
ncbi:CoA transferase subunit A [Brachyspira hyodysenteriae]|uniref:CoA transferase subunit A n=1 Tax=Brachyspira hyodysenteriae TaxID=159 RepID=UPI0022CD4672|nr:CoA transferase subunit A [Brachyspira hyodysenteriae]MCZ9840428.1 CoA transferase subunit A [Brachyspira hyodysenteriae]MCZ9848815.1 CoA transferase subunit A [Brachyspira hyodysenteriae]MCZ9852296.1 CoA transferase subunit A [Brachyspira hyodysenteriae]MCZ9861919.1 CoA transferase subunit A [Brachyspira hyodysenteriae]MCZ9869167.1 CoA transferase subunit A [Brachyspira hyodysenteriae]